MQTVIYLHGFLSSPLSKKALQTKSWLAENLPEWRFESPLLSPHASLAKQSITELLSQIEGPRCLIGSSLGGFWSTWAVEQGLAEKAVLINPAVKPYRRFRMSLGQTFKLFYSDDTYTMAAEDLEELERCSANKISCAERYWVFLQTEDEILDYTFAEKHYSQSKLLIEQGGDHSFVGYDKHLPAIMQFFRV